MTRTKRWAAWLVCAATLGAPAVASAGSGIGRARRLGVGVAGSSRDAGPSGLSLKYFFRRRVAAQATLGWYGGGRLGVNLDGVAEIGSGIRVGGAGTVTVAVGAGVFALLGNQNNSLYSVNGVLEVGWRFARFPLEVVLGWRPAYRFDITPALTPRSSGAAVRWFF